MDRGKNVNTILESGVVIQVSETKASTTLELGG